MISAFEALATVKKKDGTIFISGPLGLNGRNEVKGIHRHHSEKTAREE